MTARPGPARDRADQIAVARHLSRELSRSGIPRSVLESEP